MSGTSDLTVITGPDVTRLLEGSERAVVEIVRSAYVAHARGQTSVPHSTFLRFPEHTENRIIALPAYLMDEGGTAGVKWISSFPANVRRGLARAAAVIVLNSLVDGRPNALLEGAVISAKRTAASATLAASLLHDESQPSRIGLIGCGKINFEILRFMLATGPSIEAIAVFDLDRDQVRRFRCSAQDLTGVRVEEMRGIDDLLACSSLISFATTASRPHVSDLSACPLVPRFCTSHSETCHRMRSSPATTSLTTLITCAGLEPRSTLRPKDWATEPSSGVRSATS